MTKRNTGVFVSQKINLTILELLPIVTGIILAITIFVLNKFLPSRVPLFYSLNWGEYQLASQLQLYILPAIILCICLVNLMIYWHLKEASLLKNILLMISIISTLILIVSYSKIVSLFI